MLNWSYWFECMISTLTLGCLVCLSWVWVLKAVVLIFFNFLASVLHKGHFEITYGKGADCVLHVNVAWQCGWVVQVILGSLSKDVFEPRTSTWSEVFSLFTCLDANKFVLLSFFSLIKTIYPRVWTKPLQGDAKSPLPVDVLRSKTPLLKLPILVTERP